MYSARLSSLKRTARQQEIPENRRMGIRGVQLRSRIGQVHGRLQKPLRLRIRVPYAGEGEGPYLPPVPEALNRAACPRRQVPGAAAGGRQSEQENFLVGRELLTAK